MTCLVSQQELHQQLWRAHFWQDSVIFSNGPYSKMGQCDKFGVPFFDPQHARVGLHAAFAGDQMAAENGRFCRCLSELALAKLADPNGYAARSEFPEHPEAQIEVAK